MINLHSIKIPTLQDRKIFPLQVYTDLHPKLLWKCTLRGFFPRTRGRGGSGWRGRAGCPPRPRVFGGGSSPLAQGHGEGIEHPEAMGGRRRVTAAGARLAPAARGTREPPVTPPQYGLRLRQLPPLPASSTLRGRRGTRLLRHRRQRGKRDVPTCRVRGSVLGRSGHPPPRRRPRDRRGFSCQANLEFLKPDEQEEERLFWDLTC